MNKKKLKRLTLEELIARKMQGENDKEKYKEIEVEILEGSLLVKKMPLTTVLRMMDGIQEEDAIGNVEFFKELIFKSCPLFQDKKLLDTYADDIAEPFDIVTAVLDDNLIAMSNVAQKIMEFYGLEEENTSQKIKNS